MDCFNPKVKQSHHLLLIFFRCSISQLDELPIKAQPKNINKNLAIQTCHPQTRSMVAAENTVVGSPKSQPERCGNSPDSWNSSILEKLVKLSRIHFCFLQTVFLHASFEDICTPWEEIKVIPPNKTKSKCQRNFSSKCSQIKSHFFTFVLPSLSLSVSPPKS